MNYLSKLKEELKTDRQFVLFLLVAVFVGMSGGIYSTIFPNYLNDVLHLTASQRGMLEIPREFPGVTIMFVLGLLVFIGDIKSARWSTLIGAIGIFGIGFLGKSYSSMVLWMIIYSLGTHMYMPLAPNIGMSLSKKENYGARLGRYSAYGLVSTLIGYAFVWVGFKIFNMQYQTAYIISGIFYLTASVIFWKMKPDAPKKDKKIKIVLRKKYSLYYVLSIINGARKQIFLTFAPWVLITVYHLDPPTFAILGVVVSVISIGTRTLVGRAIDKLGEQKVLTAEAILLIFICLGYATAGLLFNPSVAVVIIAGCFILDQSMSVVEMARSTYVKKIAIDPEDVTPTLSAGLSFDHIVAMSIPALGGILWTATGSYQTVFAAASVIAVLNVILTSRIKV